MSDAAGGVLLAGRIVLSFFFYFSAFGHITREAQMRGYARSSGFPIPIVAGWPAGLWLLAGAVSVSFGIWADVGSLMLALWVIPTALWFHGFWKVEDQMQRMTQMQLFFRNLTFLGSFVALFGVFAGFGGAVPFTITGPIFDF
jgi:putative oxidoreductase